MIQKFFPEFIDSTLPESPYAVKGIIRQVFDLFDVIDSLTRSLFSCFAKVFLS